MSHTRQQTSLSPRAHTLPAPRGRKLPIGWSVLALSLGCGAFWVMLIKALM